MLHSEVAAGFFPGRYSFAQWLPDGTAIVFLVATAEDLTVEDVVALPVAFRVAVYRDTPKSCYGWSKVGRCPVLQPNSCLTSTVCEKGPSFRSPLAFPIQGFESPVYGGPVCPRRHSDGPLFGRTFPHIVEPPHLEAQLDGPGIKVSLLQIRVVA